MRVRKLSPTGDFLFGQGSLDYYINMPETVAQAVKTRLQLNLGEWFVDISDGTNWAGGVLGYNTQGSRDLVIQDRVLGTPNLTQINGYASSLNGQNRQFDVQMSIETAYGTVTLSQTF